MSSQYARIIRRRPIEEEFAEFARGSFSAHTLRNYQLGPAKAILRSVGLQLGGQFGVVFSRQAGKDELLSQILAFLLMSYQERGGSIVVAVPAFRPQATIMTDRLMERLEDAGAEHAKARHGYVIQCGRSSARFLSASPQANVRGQTADLMLVANEAQDIDPDVWDAAFDPMAATTNATTLFMGTVWSQETLLARQMRYLEEREREDGASRLWKVDWLEVARELPAYGKHVQARMAQLGEDHPFIKTEYKLEELEHAGGLFGPERLAAMQGDHQRQSCATPGNKYALLIDVAGEDEAVERPGVFDPEARRDATALTVVEICFQGEGRDTALDFAELPIYRVVNRMAWTGERHATLHSRIVELARNTWKASVVVVDSTGVGAGLASFLKTVLESSARGGAVIPVVPFVFTAQSKSRMGWEFTALIDNERFKDYRESEPVGSTEAMVTDVYWSQLRSIRYSVADGPGKAMSWAAHHGHDDLVMSAALVTQIEKMDFRTRTARGVGGAMQ